MSDVVARICSGAGMGLSWANWVLDMRGVENDSRNDIVMFVAYLLQAVFSISYALFLFSVV